MKRWFEVWGAAGSLLLAGWIGGGSQGPDEVQAPTPVGVGVVEASLVDTFEASPEFFVLVDPTEPEPRPRGVLRRVRLQLEGVEWQVERELLLFEPGTRLHTLEHYFDDHCRLVHREQRRGHGGRTLRASWPLPGALPPAGRATRLREWEPRVTQWFGTRRYEQRFEAARGWCGPLGLFERLRWGLDPGDQVARFDVSSGLPELLEVQVRDRRLPLSGLPLRWVALTGAGGESRGEALFVAGELLAISWQAGGLRAQRIPRERYETLARRHPLIEREEREPGPDAGSEPIVRLRD